MSSTDSCAICATPELSLHEDYFKSRKLPRPLESEERRVSQRLATELFHRECARCRNDDDLDPNLCPSCRHLRLRHLLCCVAATERPMDFRVWVCRFEDIPERMSACSFCRLVARAVLTYGNLSGVKPGAKYQGSLVISVKRMGTIQAGHRSFSSRSTVFGSGRQIRYSGGPSLSQGGEVDAVDNQVGAIREAPDIEVAGGIVNWPLARQWLNSCLQHHDKCATPGTGAGITLPTNFRVIDVNKRRLVQMLPSCQFVALSYVWGRDPDPTKLVTTRLSIKALQEDGGLAARDMPVTIEDAMEVCRRLEEPYLWVDRFCIVQDDHDDKVEQIAAMAAIYSLAKLVIIVADGNIDTGIAGVSRERAQGQVRDRIAGLDFSLNELSHWGKISRGGCIWSTRGWTYQEAVLARRKLILTESQAFFECQNGTPGEDGVSGYGSEYLFVGNYARQYHPALVDTFYHHLGVYRKRSLTNPSDIYNAIDGVANALYGELGSLWWGLPRRDFDQALLWCIRWDDAPKSWVAGPAGNGTKPSWSWSATDRDITLIDVVDGLRPLRYCETLVAWAHVREGADALAQRVAESVETVSGSKPLSQLHNGQDTCGCLSEMSEDEVERLLYPVVAWSHGCITAPYPFAKLENTTFPTLRSQIKSRWACRHRYWLEAFRGAAHPKPPPDDTTVPSGPGTIFTWAQTALFPLRGSITTQETGFIGTTTSGNLIIVDESSEPAGMLVAQDNELDLEPGIAGRPKFEFIALSAGKIDCMVVFRDGHYKTSSVEPPQRESTNITSPDFLGTEQQEPEELTDWEEARAPEELTVWDRAGGCLFPLPVVNVMLVERTGENRARRVSVGWVYLTSWLSARPEFKMICLE
ncbi:heterokaryon incompatibility protein-domain-containing protein [Chaetomium fimeti]|uniref:Heterokaryon incompatibility protein-domain-containing protein n=1 Tax=Chaetomium fimeti TaxID=1854472 RepID=A0AAE0HG16_9PEZI|nr:heterokaryon incompatibility protein-domain-containing protein [Chaetomium fimeti]